MKSLLSELMQYDIHPEELDEIGNMAKEKTRFCVRRLKGCAGHLSGIFRVFKKTVYHGGRSSGSVVRKSEVPDW